MEPEDNTPNIVTVSYLKPPKNLSETQKKIWDDTVKTFPADYFEAQTVPQLIEYVQACEYSQIVTNQIEAHMKENAREPDWVKTLDTLLKMKNTQARLVAALSKNLMISNSSTRNHRGNNKPMTQTAAPWET